MGYGLALIALFVIFALGVIIHDKLEDRREKISSKPTREVHPQ